jgi:fructokinase
MPGRTESARESAVSNKRALAFGEALIDVYPDRRVVAGAPLHVAAHLAARGWAAHLITRLGDDDDGRRILGVLRRLDVDTSFVEIDPELPTGEVTIDLRGTSHSFTIHAPAAWDATTGPAELPPHDIFLAGSLPGRDARGRATLARLFEASDAPIRVFDVNLRPPHLDAEVLRLGMAHASLVKMNEDEFGEVARLLGVPARSDSYFDLGRGLELLCVTRGPGGAELFAASGDRWSVEGKQVEVVDTVGAGDVFTAALVDALATGASEEQALRQGRDAAASVVGSRGGLPVLPPDAPPSPR